MINARVFERLMVALTYLLGHLWLLFEVDVYDSLTSGLRRGRHRMGKIWGAGQDHGVKTVCILMYMLKNRRVKDTPAPQSNRSCMRTSVVSA